MVDSENLPSLALEPGINELLDESMSFHPLNRMGLIGEKR